LEILISIGFFEYAGYRYETDVAVIKFGFLMQHRPSSTGEGKEDEVFAK
jgi:hypothetical protein